MLSPMPARDAIEAAAKILREGKVPVRHKAERIAGALDSVALAMALAQEPQSQSKDEVRA